MSLLKNNPLFNSLITFTKNGIEIANYVQIRNAITTRYKEIYGDDIDLSTSTADGQYIEMMCLIINNILQSVKSFYSNLDVEVAQGKFLEMLSALTNVTRRPAQNSTASIKVTLTDLASITVGPSFLGAQYESLEFLDKNGTEWVFKPSELTTFNLDEEQTIIVTCSQGGPVRADAGWIDRPLDASLLMTVVQSEPAEIGTYEETDSQLRARRSQSLGSSGITVLQSLVGAMLSISGIEDVKVYNNDSSAAIEAKDGTEISAHSVYVIIRKSANSNISKELLGSSLYEKMTPGIQFAVPGTEQGQPLPDDGDTMKKGIVRRYQYVQRIQGTPVDAGIVQYANWKEATPDNPTIVITLTKNASYDASRLAASAYNASTSEKIAAKVIQYMNELSLSENGKPALIQMQAQLADPMFKGLPTFFVNSVTIDSVSADYENTDTYFHYTSFTAAENGSTVTITIS